MSSTELDSAETAPSDIVNTTHVNAVSVALRKQEPLVEVEEEPSRTEEEEPSKAVEEVEDMEVLHLESEVIEGNEKVVALDYEINGERVKALLDSGASGCFIAAKLAGKLHLETEACNPKTVRSVHSTEVVNKTALVPVEAGGWKTHVKAYVLSAMTGQEVLLGMPFFRMYGSHIDWGRREFRPPGWLPTTNVTEEDEHIMRACTVTVAKAERIVKAKEAEMFVLFVRNSSVVAPPERVDRLLSDFKDVIVDDLPQELPPQRKTDHEIVTDDSKRPPFRRPYRMSRYEWAELDKQVKMLLARGVIRESSSPFGAPVLFIKKKTGELRMCVDYRALNELTVKNRYPLPRIDDILDTLHGAKVFSKLDLHSGYHQVRIKEEDIPKTAFTTRSGHYEYLVMPFGLCNAPSTFQKLMNDTLKPFLQKTVCVYLDDIIIFSPDEESHGRHVEEVLLKLREQQFYAKKSKCEFYRSEMEFLGHMVTAEGIKPNPDKVRAVQDWETPQTGLNLMSFLGLAGYYRRFIPSYSRIAAPLTDLAAASAHTKRKKGSVPPTRPLKPFIWTEDCQKAFEAIKKILTSAEVMVIPTMDVVFKVSTDACDIAVGAVLQQWDKESKSWRPVAYESAKLTATERNYCTREKEFMAIIHAIKKWRHYLLGQPFLIETDHQSLTYFSSQTEPPSGRLSRWLDLLADFDFQIKYVPGEQNGAADALSRMDVNRMSLVELDDDESELRVHHVWEVETDDELKELIRGGYAEDPYFKDVWAALEGLQERPPLKVKKEIRQHIEHFSVKDGFLYYETHPGGEEGKRMCIPEGEARERVKLLAHDHPAAGHYGYYKTFDRLQRFCYWPKMIKEMKWYTKSCPVCQMAKTRTQGTQGLLQQLPQPTKNWSDITMDFMPGSGIPMSNNGFDNLWVVVDRMSKQVHLVPCKKTITAEELADLYLDRIFRYHGVPRSIVSDRDKLFTSKLWQTLQHRLGTAVKLSTANHPQTDGQTERVNKEVRQLLRIYCQENPRSWDEMLPVMEFAINSANHTAHGYTPFEVNYGFTPDGPAYESTFTMDRPHHQMDDWLDKLQMMHQDIQDKIQEGKAVQERRINPKRTEVTFKEGDQVLVHQRAYYKLGEHTKLHNAYLGPFRTGKFLGPNACKIHFPAGVRKHDAINVQYLKPWVDRGGWEEPPLNRENQLRDINRVTRIVGIIEEDDEALVTWQGCDPSRATAVPRSFFQHMDDDKLGLLLNEWNEFQGPDQDEDEDQEE